MAGGETQSSGGITTAGGGFFRARIAPPARQRKIPLRCISGHAPQLSRMLVGKPGEMLLGRFLTTILLTQDEKLTFRRAVLRTRRCRGRRSARATRTQ